MSKPAEYAREPDLLTHRDDDYLMMEQEFEAYDDGQDEGLTPRTQKRGTSRKIWRWVRRAMYVLIFLGVTSPIAAFYVIYQNVTVPDPQTVAFGQAQPVTIYYGNGQVMDKITTNARIFIKANEIPDNVRHAVEAAEDETFETNNGFDVKAIFRSAYNQLTGGAGGGSTITQEYIKKATGNEQHTLTRKITEAAEAFKMTKTYTNKNDILAAYLNIVYFGRGANGIESAARTYYGVDAAHLTPEQAAFLAGMIQLPSRSNVVSYEHTRFDYVWGRMAANHWITAAQYQAGKFPTPLPVSTGNTSLTWDKSLIVTQVLDELQVQGWSEEQLKAQGAQIYTTIDPNAQAAAENSISTTLQPDAHLMNGGPMVVGGRTVTDDGMGRTATKTNAVVKNTEAASLVSINPTTGEILAYFGGNNPQATQLDMANTLHQAGSSFKPYVLTAGLEKDPHIGLNSLYDPTSGQVIDGTKIKNADGDTCSNPCSVQDAMTNSINTVFYKMGAQVGTPSVRQAALQAGIEPTHTNYLGQTVPMLEEYDPKTLKPVNPVQVLGGISIGQYGVTVRDQAQGYATFANNGMYIPSHFVKKVTNISNQNVLYQFNTAAKPAFAPSDPTKNQAIAKTVSDSIQYVAGKNGFGLANGRPADAKTGTQNFVSGDNVDNGWNSDGWTVGFTPSVVTAVWFGHYDRPGPLFGNGNGGSGTDYSVFGRTEPGHIWMNYMNAFLGNSPVQQFPGTPNDITGDWNFVTTQAVNASSTQSSTSQSNTNQQSQPSQTTDQQPPSFTFPTTFPGGGGGHHHSSTDTAPTTTASCTPFVNPGCTGGVPGGG